MARKPRWRSREESTFAFQAQMALVGRGGAGCPQGTQGRARSRGWAQEGWTWSRRTPGSGTGDWVGTESWGGPHKERGRAFWVQGESVQAGASLALQRDPRVFGAEVGPQELPSLPDGLDFRACLAPLCLSLLASR